MHLDRSRRSYPVLVSTVVLATTACLVPKVDPEPDPSTSSSSASVSTTSGPTPTSEPTTCPPPGSTSTDPGTDTNSTFIVTPDSGNTSTIKCNVFKQDCAEGEKCTAWAEGGGGSWNATKCVEVTGSKVPGDVCIAEGSGVSGIDDCEAGAMCWDVNAENMGICVALCKGTLEAATCDAPGFVCAISGVLNLCLPECDPLVQDCPGEELCLPGGIAFHCVAPAPGDPGQTNAPCELVNSCAKGLVCLDTASASSACDPRTTGCCQPFCEFKEGQDGTCSNPDQKCLQWFDPMMEIPLGSDDVGICAIPL